MKHAASELTPFPCRFDAKTKQMLNQISEITGFPKSFLIRHSVKQTLIDFERSRHLAFKESNDPTIGSKELE